MNRIVGSFVNPVVNAVDMEAVIERVDVDAVLERVDLNDVLDRVDIDRLIGRVDIDGLLARIDVNQLMSRIDVDALLQRIDVDDLVGRVDVARVVAEANIGNVVTGTATTVTTSVLDFARSKFVGLDAVTTRFARRIFRRRPFSPYGTARAVSGTPAGPFTRLTAYIVDTIIVTALFGVGVFLITYLANLLFAHDFDPTNTGGWWWGFAATLWAGLYFWVGLAVAGSTIGKALVGLRVVGRDGTPVHPGAAFIRVVVFPFSFIFGLGFIGIVLGRDRRALHDAAAGTKEVYDWGKRPAQLAPRVSGWLTARAERLDDTASHG